MKIIRKKTLREIAKGFELAFLYCYPEDNKNSLPVWKLALYNEKIDMLGDYIVISNTKDLKKLKNIIESELELSKERDALELTYDLTDEEKANFEKTLLQQAFNESLENTLDKGREK